MPCSSALLRPAGCRPWGPYGRVHKLDIPCSAPQKCVECSSPPAAVVAAVEYRLAESLIELLASLRSAGKLRAEPAVESQVCLDLPQCRMLVDQPLNPLMSNLPCLLPAHNPLQLNGAQSL